MCLDLEAGHDSGQSENFPEDRNLEAVLRENLDPATDAGNRCENYSSDENKTRRRRVSKRNKRCLNKSDEEEDVNVKNKDESSSFEVKTCELCSKRFQNSRALTLHLKEHNSNSNRSNGNAYVCTLCHKTLSSKSSLDRHALVHSGYKPHKCEVCGVLFTTNGNMNRHIRIHDHERRRRFQRREVKRHTCFDGCCYGFPDLYDVEFSSNNYPQIARIPCERKRRCPPPSAKKMKLDKDLTDQELFEAVRVYSCDRCNYCFPCQRTLVKHMTDCSKCKICDTQFPNTSQFENHMQDHDAIEHDEALLLTENIKREGNIEKDENMKKNTEDDEGIGGIIVHEGGKNINIKDEEEREEYTQDGERIEGNIEDDEKYEERRKALFISTLGLVPSDLFNSSKEKEKETLGLVPSDLFNNSKEKEKEKEKENVKKIPEELLQDSVFEDSSSSGELIIDESINLNNSQSNDDDCADSTSISMSSSPISRTSSETNTNASLQNINEMPTSPAEGIAKSLPPSDISENSKSPTVVDLPKGTLQCKKCGASFCSTKSYKAHSKSHSQLKLYKCDECTYRSTDKSTLQRHMRTHNGVKPYKCDICNFAFTTKTNAQRHIRKKHHISRSEDEKYAVYNIEKPENNSSANVANENPSETTCKYCKVNFGNSRLLKHHLRSLRDSCSCKPYICRKCGSGFSTKNNCTRHINKTHPEYKTKVKELLVSNRPTSNEQSEQAMNLVDNEAFTHDSQLVSVENGDTNMQIDTEENQDLENGDGSMQSDIEESQNGHNSDTSANSEYKSEKDDGELHMPERPVSTEYPRFYRELLNTSDVVSAVDGLMSLSKSVPFQAEPLDLSVRPIDLSSKDLKTLNPNNAKSFSRSLSSCRKFQNPLPVHLSVPTMYNPDAPSPPNLHEFSNNILPPRSLASLEHMAQNLNLVANAPAPIPGVQIPTPIDYSLSSKSAIQNSYASELKIVNQISVPDKKIIPCNYCHKTFTLKSNKERHIKNHHPERARPPRSRNFIPLFQGASLQRQTPNVSDVTKDRLRSVLMPKVYNGPGSNETMGNIDGETLSLIVEKNEKPPEVPNKNDTVADDYLKHGARNDFENNDLASVSSVINTANSKEINRFLKDASLTDTQTSSAEKINSPENGTVESGINGNACGKDKQFKCEFCGRAFNYSSARERHMATHTGEKPYFCSKCNARFSTKSNRDRHEKKSCCEKTNYRYKSFSNPLKDSTQSHENVPSPVDLKKGVNHLSDSRGADLLPIIMDSQLSNSNINTFFTQGILNNSLHALEHSNPLVNTSMHVLNLEYQSISPTQNLECKFCNNTYKNNDDLTNHMKELHPLEYKSLIGETFNPEDTIQSWKKNISGKRKTV